MVLAPAPLPNPLNSAMLQRLATTPTHHPIPMPRDFKKSFSGSKFGGGKSFGGGGSSYGGRKSYGSGDSFKRGPREGGFDRPTMHSATCAECGSHCEVPFKPNGKKPILCSNCFKGVNNDGPKRFDSRGGNDRPSFNAAPRQDDSALRAINQKLDSILEILATMNE